MCWCPIFRLYIILFYIDYCNSLLAGIPHSLTDAFQKGQNSAARLMFRSSKKHHVTPLWLKFHRLPISQRIEYQLSVICYNIISETTPICIFLTLFNQTLYSIPLTPLIFWLFGMQDETRNVEDSEYFLILTVSLGINFPSLSGMRQ